MPTRLRTVWLVREDRKEANGSSKPKVYIDRVASGAIICGVSVTGRTLRLARHLAQEEFRQLIHFLTTMKEKEAP